MQTFFMVFFLLCGVRSNMLMNLFLHLVWSETLKYLYLLFSDASILPLDSMYVSSVFYISYFHFDTHLLLEFIFNINTEVCTSLTVQLTSFFDTNCILSFQGTSITHFYTDYKDKLLLKLQYFYCPSFRY